MPGRHGMWTQSLWKCPHVLLVDVFAANSDEFFPTFDGPNLKPILAFASHLMKERIFWGRNRQNNSLSVYYGTTDSSGIDMSKTEDNCSHQWLFAPRSISINILILELHRAIIYRLQPFNALEMRYVSWKMSKTNGKRWITCLVQPPAARTAAVQRPRCDFVQRPNRSS